MQWIQLKQVASFPAGQCSMDIVTMVLPESDGQSDSGHLNRRVVRTASANKPKAEAY